MAKRTIKTAAGKSDLTVAAVRTSIRNATTSTSAPPRVQARSGASNASGRNAAAAVSDASGAGSAGAKRPKH